jgi:DNA-binding NarL/FixJ family response regulator
MPRLTAREREILELVAEGRTNAEIAERLWVSFGTVKKHLDNIYAKLGVHTRTAAAAFVRERWRSPQNH